MPWTVKGWWPWGSIFKSPLDFGLQLKTCSCDKRLISWWRVTNHQARKQPTGLTQTVMVRMIYSAWSWEIHGTFALVEPLTWSFWPWIFCSRKAQRKLSALLPRPQTEGLKFVFQHRENDSVRSVSLFAFSRCLHWTPALKSDLQKHALNVFGARSRRDQSKTFKHYGFCPSLFFSLRCRSIHLHFQNFHSHTHRRIHVLLHSKCK